jgi:two-component system, OmpR family, response regulator
MVGRVLVIANDLASADWLGHRLQAAGFEVARVTNLREAARRALDEDVGLVVLDLMPPVADGLDALIAIRDHRPVLPVLVLSACADVADRLQAFDAGASDFLGKPFSFDELVARLRAHARRLTWT